MRLRSPKIKFVAIDEPSSALDPRGELQLFDNLKYEKADKTMIFVTHRFGHLTKFADLIMCATSAFSGLELNGEHHSCMKDGRVIESGVHKELLSLNGEYASLYNIQARAFSAITSQVQGEALCSLLTTNKLIFKFAAPGR